MNLEYVQEQAWETAERKGFHAARAADEVLATATALAMVHSEVSEAIEAHREDDMDGFAEELADIVIRVADLAESTDVDLSREVELKLLRNKHREEMHGGKRY